MMLKSVKAKRKKKGITGIYNKLYGGIMSIYCIYKIFNCILHILNLKYSDGSSWITKLLSILTRLIFFKNIDWNSIGQFISFVFVGLMTITSIKNLVSKSYKIITSFERFENNKLKEVLLLLFVIL